MTADVSAATEESRRTSRRYPVSSALVAALCSAILLTACSTGSEPEPTEGLRDPTQGTTSSQAPETTEAPEPPTTADPVIRKVPRGQWKRILEAGVWRPGCPLGRTDLRRVEINHFDFAGEVQRGVLVVNADVAASTARIFSRLFRERFPIRRMQPLETYDGDNYASLADDNTGAYNCRRPDQINAPFMDSPHANGRAIDINPLENPWKDLRCKCWSPSAEHQERSPGPGKILKGGPVWRAFTDEGWIWQNIKVPDYMHFDTGYPSAPLGGQASG